MASPTTMPLRLVGSSCSSWRLLTVSVERATERLSIAASAYPGQSIHRQTSPSRTSW